MTRVGRLDVDLTADRVTFVGRIDDSVALGELAAQVAGPAVALDTGGITFVNSVGMREWIRFQRALVARNVRITLERVADVLITQINMIPELAQHVTIASFHAQYVCAACGYEGAPLVDAITHLAGLRRLEAPQLPCPECAGAMELADFPERYLTIFRT